MSAHETAALAATQPLLWSIRRELWENRSLTLAPLIGAGALLLGFLISATSLPERMRAAMALGSTQPGLLIAKPLGFAAVLTVVACIVGVFYCLDALHGERRDRSILFWKSLPVSDRTAVLAKAAIPLVVLPLVTFVLVLVTQLLILLASAAVLLGSGTGVGTVPWTDLKLVQRTLALLYGVVAMTLWHAPIYGWLLLVSGWARRSAFLWAALPFLAAAAVEAIGFRTTQVPEFLKDRAIGWFPRAFVRAATSDTGLSDPLTAMTAGKFLSAPELWIGFAFTALCLVAAVRLRRQRGPI